MVAVLVISFAAVRETAPPPLSFEKLTIEPLSEVKSKLLTAIISEKFLFIISLFAVIETLLPTIDPELFTEPEVDVKSTSLPAIIIDLVAKSHHYFLNYLLLLLINRFLVQYIIRH